MFDAEVFSCDVGLAKPDAAIYRYCLKEMRLEAADCIFVGDGGSNELVGAKDVGLKTVFISGIIKELWPERIPARQAVADHHIVQLPEILEIVSLQI
jgi:putative hydrolase of the HAD superfamily